jgi:hypothetical protein
VLAEKEAAADALFESAAALLDTHPCESTTSPLAR